MHRRFILHLGGTNTGKTYAGFQRLKQAPSGVYLAPLRLLALGPSRADSGWAAVKSAAAWTAAVWRSWG